MGNREREIAKAGIIGIVANIALVAMKAAVGFASNSIAIIIDALNNATDALSSIVTIIGVKLGSKKADREHPLGHGRYEHISALAVAVIIIYAGIKGAIEAVGKIVEPELLDYSAVTLALLVVAVIVKIALGIYTKRKGDEYASAALVASGKDALFDAVISTSVLVAAIVYLASGVSLEAYLGAAIAVFIVKAGVDMIRDTLDDILGKRADAELVAAIREALCSHESVLGAFDILVHEYGPSLSTVEAHVEVPAGMDAVAIDAMTRALQERVVEKCGVVLTTVGIYAIDTCDEEIMKMRDDVSAAMLAHDGIVQVHGFNVSRSEKTVKFDVVAEFGKGDAVDVFDLEHEVEAICPGYSVFITMDRDLSDI